MKPLNVLVVEDDPDMGKAVCDALSGAGHAIALATNGHGAFDLLEGTQFDAVLLDIRMPGISGQEVLRRIRTIESRMPVIMMTALAEPDVIVEMMKLGATDYIVKPFATQKLIDKLHRAIDDPAAAATPPVLDLTNPFATGADHVPQLRTNNASMLEVVQSAAAAARVMEPVLILGEVGTGKERLARAIHALSVHHSAPFVTVNCATLGDEEASQEFFGCAHYDDRGEMVIVPGRIAQAAGGTLFLHHIDELEPAMQARLVRFVENGEVVPVGARKPITVVTRIIAAASPSLVSKVANWSFLKQLYVWLSARTLLLPPLRERREDILPLAEEILETCRTQRPDLKFHDDAVRGMTQYSWPGNIRELENAIHRASIVSPTDQIRAVHLGLRSVTSHALTDSDAQHQKVAQSLADAESEHIIHVLRSVNGQKSAAARILGISRRTLYAKLQRMRETPVIPRKTGS